MHKSLYFFPENVRTPTIIRPENVHGELATFSLVRCIQISEKLQASIGQHNTGKILIPKRYLYSANLLLYKADQTDYERHCVLRSFRTENVLFHFLGFPGGSFLLFRPLELEHIECSEEILEVFPVVLNLSHKIKIDNQTFLFNIERPDPNLHPDRCAICGTPSYPPKIHPLFHSQTKDPHHVMFPLERQIEFDLAAWAREFDKLPFLFKPPLGPISGILGKHTPSPLPSLEGVPYTWPCVDSHTNWTKEQKRAFQNYVRQAWIYYKTIRPTETENAVLSIEPGVYTQKSLKRACLHIYQYGQLPNPCLKKKLESEFHAFLEASICPFNYRDVIEQPLDTFAPPDHIILFHPKKPIDVSNHEYLQIIPKFKPIFDTYITSLL